MRYIPLLFLISCGGVGDYSVFGMDIHQTNGFPTEKEMTDYLKSWNEWYGDAEQVFIYTESVYFPSDIIYGKFCGIVIGLSISVSLDERCGDPWYIMGHELCHIAKYVETKDEDDAHKSDIWQRYYDWARSK